ncbi:MAG: TonB-dependent receptor, partial [Flavisolibacter sp.]|nr:TonB-dependent receptor [Flavisolibacter sp.]
FSFTFDYFKNKNDNLVLAAPLPSSFGIPNNSISRNIGNMENKGIELSVSGDVIRSGDFRWNTSFNYTHTDNKVLSLYENQDVILPGPNNGTYNILRVGESINALFGYRYAGVNSANGNPMYYKEDGTLIQGNIPNNSYFTVIKPDDATLGTATTLATTDRFVIGNVIPKWFGGFTNTFSYKNLMLEVFLRYSGGNDIYNQTKQEVLLNQFFQNNGKVILGRWTTPGQQTDIPKQWVGKDNFINLSSQAVSRFVEKGDYLRLQNIMMAYTFNAKRLEGITRGVFKSARIYVQGQNLAIWTKYSGLDPDNFSEFGIDNSSVPQARTFSIGLNLGL